MSRRGLYLANRCTACSLRIERCFCSTFSPRNTKTKIYIVRHRAERGKPSNTAKIAQIALVGVEIWDYGNAGSELPNWPWEEGLLLYPDERAVGPMVDCRPIDGRLPTDDFRNIDKSALFVCDGSWSQTKKMVRRIAPIAKMQRLSLPEPETAVLHLRRPPTESAMSTLEAIARALGHLESADLMHHLLGIHDEFVLRARDLSRSHASVG